MSRVRLHFNACFGQNWKPLGKTKRQGKRGKQGVSGSLQMHYLLQHAKHLGWGGKGSQTVCRMQSRPQLPCRSFGRAEKARLSWEVLSSVIYTVPSTHTHSLIFNTQLEPSCSCKSVVLQRAKGLCPTEAEAKWWNPQLLGIQRLASLWSTEGKEDAMVKKQLQEN